MIENDPFRSGRHSTLPPCDCIYKTAVFLILDLPPQRNPLKLIPEQKPWFMNNIRVWATAIVVGAICASHPQEIRAQGFTGADFATWEQVGQDSYIQSSIMMAGVIAAQIRPELSACIDDWYFANEASKDGDSRHAPQAGAVQP